MSGINDTLRYNLDRIYSIYNRRKFVSPDPLEFLYNYDNIIDREIAGLTASSLAYGRVNMILKNAGYVLNTMGRSPADYLLENSVKKIFCTFEEFKHRFTDGRELSCFLSAIKGCLENYSSVENCFRNHIKREKNDIVKAVSGLVNELCDLANIKRTYLLPDPARGSACKRMFLFLRWMVRNDDVDPGGWTCVKPSNLIVPLDTHMHSISKMLAFTTRKQANLKTALEITGNFSEIQPEDPVKYDFALTRFGIRPELALSGINRFLDMEI